MTRDEAERAFSSPLWRCEKCGAWSGDGGASWRWTGAAWEHGGHDDAPQAGHFPARYFTTVADAVAFTAAADYAPRATPPTPAEVRAVAQLQGHGHGVAQVLVRRRVDGDTPHESYVWCAAWVRVIDAEVRPLSVLDRAVTNGEGQWSALGPDGPVAWSQLAAMVAEGVDHG